MSLILISEGGSEFTEVSNVQGRRHGFESGGQILTPILASGGTKYGVDISVKAWQEQYVRYELSPNYVPLSPLPLKVGVMSASSYGSAAHANVAGIFCAAVWHCLSDHSALRRLSWVGRCWPRP